MLTQTSSECIMLSLVVSKMLNLSLSKFLNSNVNFIHSFIQSIKDFRNCLSYLDIHVNIND